MLSLIDKLLLAGLPEGDHFGWKNRMSGKRVCMFYDLTGMMSSIMTNRDFYVMCCVK